MTNEITEVQSAISQLTNQSIQDLLDHIDTTSIQASQKPQVMTYRYLYELLDRVYLKIHMILDAQDHTTIRRYKKQFDQLYHEILERAADEDTEDETDRSPTLRELYQLRAYTNGINAGIANGLQKKKYFFATRGAAVTNQIYYDPVLEDGNTNKS